MVADTDGNVDTNAGNLNVPEEAANEPATTTAELEQLLVETAGGAIDSGAVLSNAWAIADAISLERDEDVPAEAAITAVVAEEEEGDDVHVVAIIPAVKLL